MFWKRNVEILCEDAVDEIVTLSQPQTYWSYGFQNDAVVHNGQNRYDPEILISSHDLLLFFHFIYFFPPHCSLITYSGTVGKTPC